jgi:hypothetical protein
VTGAGAELGAALALGLEPGFASAGELASGDALPAAQRGTGAGDPHPDADAPATMPATSRAIPRVIRTRRL